MEKLSSDKHIETGLTQGKLDEIVLGLMTGKKIDAGVMYSWKNTENPQENGHAYYETFIQNKLYQKLIMQPGLDLIAKHRETIKKALKQGGVKQLWDRGVGNDKAGKVSDMVLGDTVDGIDYLPVDVSESACIQAPITGTTIGETPVVIGQLSAQIHQPNTSIIYWKGFDLIGESEGSYDALFVIQPFVIGTQQFKAKYIHFADFSFEKAGLSVLSLQAYGGETVRWSVQLNEFIYHTRSPRWIINPSLSYKQFTLSSWTYYDLGYWSQSLGIQYKSKKLSVSDAMDAQLSIVYNQSISSEGFGQDQTAMIGITFTPKKK